MDDALLDSIVLREWRQKDFEIIIAARKDQFIRQGYGFVNDIREYNSKDTSDKSIPEQKDKYVARFAITIEDRAIGDIGCLSSEEPNVGSIVYWISKEYRNKGITTRAVELFTEYMFKEYNFHHVSASIFNWNDASAKVLEKAGYFTRIPLAKRDKSKEGINEIITYYKLNKNFLAEAIKKTA
jgi:[ribosomal protein S5]-alanine N-acetyltransferase